MAIRAHGWKLLLFDEKGEQVSEVPNSGFEKGILFVFLSTGKQFEFFLRVTGGKTMVPLVDRDYTNTILVREGKCGSKNSY